MQLYNMVLVGGLRYNNRKPPVNLLYRGLFARGLAAIVLNVATVVLLRLGLVISKKVNDFTKWLITVQ